MKRQWQLPWDWLGLGLVLVVYLALALFYNAAIPLGKGPDELTHHIYARFISDHGRLPVTWAEREAAGIRANFPPLYHLPVALFIRLAGIGPGEVSPALKVSWEPATRPLIDIVLPRATLIRTEDERPPYRGEYLAWMIGRWVSTVLSAGTILLTFLTVRVLLPQRPRLALLAAALLACIPAYLFISAVLNDDNMVGLMMTAYLLLLAWLLRGKDSVWLYLGLGLLIGLTVTAKYNGGLIALSAAATIGLMRRQKGWSWREVAWRVGLVWLATGLGAGWWFAWGELFFNQVDRYGLILGALKPFVAESNIDVGSNRLLSFFSSSVQDPGLPTNGITGNFWDWLRRIFETSWALTVFGVPPYLLYWPIITLLAGLSLLAGAGVWLAYRRGDDFQKRWILAFLLHFILVFPLPVARFFLTQRINDTAQGRHVFYPAVPVVLVLLLVGLAYWLKPRWQPRLASVGLAGLLAWAVYHGLYLWSAYPPPLPVRTTAGPQMEVAYPAAQVFKARPLAGAAETAILELTGYEARLTGPEPVLDLVLRWQSLAQAAEDYQTEISLVDETGVTRLTWLSQPAGGRFPTRAWQPGDIVRDRLAIPLAGLPAGSYHLTLRLLGWTEPLAAAVALTTITLPKAAAQPGPAPALWQGGRVAAGEPVYRYRATIPVTLAGPAGIQLIGPGGKAFSPLAVTGSLAVFMVDYNWPSGQYHLAEPLPSLSLWVENFDWNFTPPAMMVPVQANFNREVLLLGYDLPSRRVQPGQGLPLVLHWQGLSRMQRSYTIFSNLLDDRQQKWGGYDRLPKETYHTFLWVPGEIVSDGFVLPVDPAAPPGVYHVSLGLYYPLAGQPVSLPLVQDDQVIDATSVTIGPIKVGGPPPGAVLAPAQVAPQVPLSTALGQPPVIRLRGYDLAQAGTGLRLKLYWESLAVTPVDWSLFVHVRNEAGETVAQRDGPAGGGRYPTSLWDAGELIADELEVPAEGLAAGQYTLVIGLYDLASGTRLAVPGSPAGEISLSEITSPLD